jgi:hypothetical protein
MSSGRNRGGRWYWIGGGLGLGLIGATLAFLSIPRSGQAPKNAAKPVAAKKPVAAEATLAELSAAIRAGDGAALKAFSARMTPPENTTATAVEQAGAVDLIEALEALRSTYPNGTVQARELILRTAVKTVNRFAVDPAPAGWAKAWTPLHEILSVGLCDPSAKVRIVALGESAGLWEWSPGTPMHLSEEKALSSWKEGLHNLVLRQLKAAEPSVRIAAIDCLGKLAIDSASAPALAGLSDPEPQVRLRTVRAFAARRSVLSEEAMLPLLHDRVSEIAEYAEGVMKLRGLTDDQIVLARLISHPRADMRASSIPLLLKRSDIDPEVWLLFLTNDANETVRLQAVQACRGRVSPEVRHRLREMAAADDSAAIRDLANTLAPDDSTVALPPLPGSPSLNPKAN